MAGGKKGLGNVIVGGQYLIGPLVGKGSFGEVYMGVDVLTRAEVGVKAESANTETPQLRYEAGVFRKLHGGAGMPVLKWYGCFKNYRILVMDLLGPNLEELFDLCSRRFSLKTVLLLADQMLRRLEYVHYKGFLHRDIKPENFLMGLGKDRNLVHLIDFGLAKPYVDPKTKAHVAYGENRKVPGTARYSSIHAHLGLEQSRRDDMESLAYVFVYFVKGSLPWQGVRAVYRKKRYEKIAEIKMSTPVDEICQDIPQEFAVFLKYCRELKFEEKPSYSSARQTFRDLCRSLGLKSDPVYDWNV